MKSIEKLPEGWNIVCIKDTGRIVTGKTPPTSSYKYWGGDIPFITPSDISDKREIINTERYVTEIGLRFSNEIPKRSLLCTCIASIGKNAINNKRSCTNQQINTIIPNHYYSLDYLYYTIEFAKPIMQKIAAQTAVSILNKTEFGEINIIAPANKEEQENIASILLALDNAIDYTKAHIEKETLIKQGLMHDLFTRGIDKEGNIRRDRTHKFKDSPLGRIPEEWDVKELQQVGDIQVSNVDKKTIKGEDPIKLCNYIDVYKNQYIDSTIEFMNATATNSEICNFSLEKGDVLFTKDSETPDDIAVPSVLIENIDKLVSGYHLAIVRPNKSVIRGLFLMKALQLSHVNKHFRNMASGMTRFGLTQKAIFTAKVPVPRDKEEQEIIENILFRIDNHISDEKHRLSKLESLKNGLMQDLLTGKVRVNHLIKQGASA